MNEFIIKIIQPIISVKPPIGVIGPRNEKLIFVIDCVERRNMLNEKRTIPIEKNNNNYLLLSGNFVKKDKALNKDKMKRQELLVLEDFEEYLLFSNKPFSLPAYPKKYFLISKNAKFVVYKNPDKSPDEFSKNIPQFIILANWINEIDNISLGFQNNNEELKAKYFKCHRWYGNN